MKRGIQVLFFLLAILGKDCNAQSTEMVRDSMARVVAVNVLEHQFLIAGELYKVGKFKLAYPSTINADSLFRDCVAAYKTLYASIHPDKRFRFLTDHFYEQIIPVSQYFRNADVAHLFIIHQQALHPKVAAPDLKHDSTEPHAHPHN